MKEQIMEKLFNNKELTSEEMVYIGRNLGDSVHSSLPFDHAKGDTLEACGVCKDDFDTLNKYIDVNIEGKKDEIKGMSMYIEKMEEIALSSPKHLRMMLLNYVRLTFQSQHPLLHLLMGLKGGH